MKKKTHIFDKLKFVRINGSNIAISVVNPRGELNGDCAWGIWVGSKRLIEICNIDDGDRQLQVLLHEILHVIDCDRCSHDKLTETHIQSISSGIYQVLSDNPEICQLFINKYKLENKK